MHILGVCLDRAFSFYTTNQMDFTFEFQVGTDNQKAHELSAEQMCQLFCNDIPANDKPKVELAFSMGYLALIFQIESAMTEDKEKASEIVGKLMKDGKKWQMGKMVSTLTGLLKSKLEEQDDEETD